MASPHPARGSCCEGHNLPCPGTVAALNGGGNNAVPELRWHGASELCPFAPGLALPLTSSLPLACPVLVPTMSRGPLGWGLWAPPFHQATTSWCLSFSPVGFSDLEVFVQAPCLNPELPFCMQQETGNSGGGLLEAAKEITAPATLLINTRADNNVIKLFMHRGSCCCCWRKVLDAGFEEEHRRHAAAHGFEGVLPLPSRPRHPWQGADVEFRCTESAVKFLLNTSFTYAQACTHVHTKLQVLGSICRKKTESIRTDSVT